MENVSPEHVSELRSLFGITAQPLGIFCDPNKLFVICKHDTEKLTYWNRTKQSWVDNIFEASTWPQDKEGEIPYLLNNVYSRFEGFKAKNYKLVGISSSLYPCAIKYNNELYLKSYNAECAEFTTDYTNCLWIQGPYKAVDIMWHLITSPPKKTDWKI